MIGPIPRTESTDWAGAGTSSLPGQTPSNIMAQDSSRRIRNFLPHLAEGGTPGGMGMRVPHLASGGLLPFGGFQNPNLSPFEIGRRQEMKDKQMAKGRLNAAGMGDGDTSDMSSSQMTQMLAGDNKSNAYQGPSSYPGQFNSGAPLDTDAAPQNLAGGGMGMRVNGPVPDPSRSAPEARDTKNDTVPAMLTPREYVMPEDVVLKKGTDFFDKLRDSTRAGPTGGMKKPSGPVNLATGGTPQEAELARLKAATQADTSVNQYSVPGAVLNTAADVAAKGVNYLAGDTTPVPVAAVPPKEFRAQQQLETMPPEQQVDYQRSLAATQAGMRRQNAPAQVLDTTDAQGMRHQQINPEWVASPAGQAQAAQDKIDTQGTRDWVAKNAAAEDVNAQAVQAEGMRQTQQKAADDFKTVMQRERDMQELQLQGQERSNIMNQGILSNSGASEAGLRALAATMTNYNPAASPGSAYRGQDITAQTAEADRAAKERMNTEDVTGRTAMSGNTQNREDARFVAGKEFERSQKGTENTNKQFEAAHSDVFGGEDKTGKYVPGIWDTGTFGGIDTEKDTAAGARVKQGYAMAGISPEALDKVDLIPISRGVIQAWTKAAPGKPAQPITDMTGSIAEVGKKLHALSGGAR